MIEYKEALRYVLDSGQKVPSRGDTSTIRVLGYHLKIDLDGDRFPLLTLRPINFRAVIAEMLWFLKGGREDRKLYLEDLKTLGAGFWNPWDMGDGTIGVSYGSQWRNFNGSGTDQIAYALHETVYNPRSRRALVCAWNPVELDKMALPPCHFAFQLHVGFTNSGRAKKLHLTVFQRSCDLYIGLPHNIAGYAFLLHLFSRIARLQPGTLHFLISDLHLYTDHLENAQKLLSRAPRPSPRIVWNRPPTCIEDIERMDGGWVDLAGYDPHPSLPNVPILV